MAVLNVTLMVSCLASDIRTKGDSADTRRRIRPGLKLERGRRIFPIVFMIADFDASRNRTVSTLAV